MGYIGNRPDAFQYTSTSYQQLSGDGVTTTFTLSRQVSANGDIEVVVNNVPQEPGVAYYVSDLINLNFTAAPSAAANNIYIVYRSYVQSGIAPAANTVTTSAIAANTIQPWQLTNSLLNPIVNTFTANGTGTTYTLAFTPPSANAVVVTINGITQNHPENYSTNGTTLTFTDAPAANSVVRVLQQAVIGTSIVPIDGSVSTSKLADGSVTTSKLASGVTLSSANLSGGSINNMTIGGTTANTGAFTTLSVSGAFSANGGATLGDASGDALTINSSAVSIPNGLNFDSNTLVIDAANNRVGVATASPTVALDVTGAVKASGLITASGATSGFVTDATNGYALFTGDPGSYNLARSGVTVVLKSGGGVVLQSGTSAIVAFQTNGANERMRIDGSGNVGIGTNSPGSPLEVTQSNSPVVSGLKVNGPTWSSIDITTSNADSGARNWRIAGVYNSFGRFEIISGSSSGGVPDTTVLGLKKSSSVALEGTTPQSGTGITFPSTQSASSDANTLDDYEEGTFTPFFTGSISNPTQTGGGVTGLYIKVGKLVWVSIQMAGVSYTGGSGNLGIGGLPFQASTGNGDVPAVYETTNAYPAGKTNLFAYTTNGSTILGFAYTGGTAGTTIPTVSYGSSWNLYIVFCYRATA